MSAAPSTGRSRSRTIRASGTAARTPVSIRRVELGVRRAEHAPGQHDVDRPARDAQLPGDRDGHRRQLVGEPVHDPARDRVAFPGDLEDERRQLLEPARVHRALVHPARDVDRAPHPETLRDAPLQGGRRPASVAGPNGRRKRLAPDALAPAPVAGQVADRRQPRRPPVRADAGGIHPGAADHDDPPAIRGAGAQRREGVVVDAHPLGHAGRRKGGVQRADVGRKVGPGHAEDAEAGLAAPRRPRAPPVR